MANICTSCHVLSRGKALLGRKPLEKLLFSWQTRQFTNRPVPVKTNKYLNPPVKVQSKLLSTSCTQFCDVKQKILELINDSSSDKDKATSEGGKGEKNGEEDLTEEELRVLEEIEEEERRVREHRESELKDYSIWDKGEATREVFEERKLTKSLSEGHTHFRDQTRVIQDVIDEMWNPLPEEEEFEEEELEMYPRGKTGVFDLGELVYLLREENGTEIVAITIPKEFDYADHMVITTVRNDRHLMALATFVRKRFKCKERKPTDRIPHLEKRRNHKGWIALDLGNIILHIFDQETRDYYDLELLWTVGPLYDDLTNAKDPEIVQLLNTIV